MKKQYAWKNCLAAATMVFGTSALAVSEPSVTQMDFRAAEDALRRIHAGKVSEAVVKIPSDEIIPAFWEVKVERYDLENEVRRFCAKYPLDMRSRRLLNTLFLIEVTRDIPKDPEVFLGNWGVVKGCLYMHDETNNLINGYVPETKPILFLKAVHSEKIKQFKEPLGWEEKYEVSAAGFTDDLWRIGKARGEILEKFPKSVTYDQESIEFQVINREAIADKTLVKEYDDAVAARKHRVWVISTQAEIQQLCKEPLSAVPELSSYLRKHPHDRAFESQIKAIAGLTDKQLAEMRAGFPPMDAATSASYLRHLPDYTVPFDALYKKAVYTSHGDRPPTEVLGLIEEATRWGGLFDPPEIPGTKAMRKFKLQQWLRIAHLIETKRDAKFDLAQQSKDESETSEQRAKRQWQELARDVHGQVELFINEEYNENSKEDKAELQHEISEHIKSKEHAERIVKDLFNPEYRSDILLPGFAWPKTK